MSFDVYFTCYTQGNTEVKWDQLVHITFYKNKSLSNILHRSDMKMKLTCNCITMNSTV